MPPLFSVVIPTYDRASTVVPALRSVLAQTDRDWECFVVDDGSTDGTREALKPFVDPRVKLVFNERNRGQHACRNQAIRMAQGEWIAFLDSDDLFLPGRLAALRAAIARAPGRGFWFTNAYLHRWGRIIGMLFDPAREIPEGKVPGHYAVGDRWLPYVTTMVAVRREAFSRTGFFREDLRILEDTELYGRMFKDGLEVGALKDPLAVRFLHESQITRDHQRDFLEAMEALKNSGAPPEEAAAHRRRVAREVAGYLWKSLKTREARELLLAELGPAATSDCLYRATFVPSPLLALGRGLRRAWLTARFHPWLTPPDWREASRAVERLLS